MELRALADEATARTGLADFGSPHHEAVFGAWAEDLDGPNLNDNGRAFLARLAVENLARRLQIVDFVTQHPEVEEVAVPRIVLIMGFPRSGTTLLHNLMHRHPMARSLLRWELMRPLPPPEAATYATDPRIAKVQASVEALRGTDVERMHWVEAMDPEECTWGWYDGAGLLGRSCLGTMPTWWRHLRDSDGMETMREYRQLIKILLWRNPLPAGGVLVLKNPMACGHIDAFAEVFPEATVVMTHRDPWRVLTSSSAITEAIQTPFASPSHLEAMRDDGARDQATLVFLAESARALMNFAERERAPVHHLTYDELMAGPTAAGAAAFRSAGLERETDRFVEAVQSYLEAQRAGKRAAPHESYHHYGYGEDDVRTDPTLSAYCDRFGVEPERVRLTAPG